MEFFFLIWFNLVNARSYLVVAPELFRGGVVENISVKIFDYKEPVHVKAKLEVRGHVITSASAEITKSGTIRLLTPEDIAGKARLNICGNCHLQSGYIFTNETMITISPRGTISFIETDKPRYNPGQSVLINVYIMNPELLPKNVPVKLFLMDSRGSRVFQWNLETWEIVNGILSKEFPLSKQPVLGQWTVYADIQSFTYNSTFIVEHYRVPKFEVNLNVPKYIDKFNPTGTVTVNANYLFGSTLNGNINVNYTIVGLDEFSSFKSGTKFFDDFISNGIYSFNIDFASIWSEMDPPPNFMARLEVWTKVTVENGLTETEFNDSCIVSLKPVIIAFDENMSNNFKPEMPFKTQLSVTTPDGEPANDVQISLKIEFVNSTPPLILNTSSKSGIAIFDIPALNREHEFIWLEAKIIAIQGRNASDYASVFRSLYSWNSPSSCHLSLESVTPGQHSRDIEKLKLTTNCDDNYELFYEIVSKGNILLSKSVIITANRAETGLFESFLNLELSNLMAPVSKVLAFYIREDKEAIADSIVLNIHGKLENEISMSLSPNVLAPDEQINITIEGTPEQRVCINIADESVDMNQLSKMTSDKIFQMLGDLENGEQGQEWWQLRRRKRNIDWEVPHTRDSEFAFHDVGLVYLTDEIILNHKQPIKLVPAMILALTQETEQAKDRSIATFKKQEPLNRIYFPETWIWHCFTLRSHKEVFKLQTPHSVTRWRAQAIGMSPTKGVGISQIQKFNTEKSVFVDFIFAAKTIRFEEIELPVTVYNKANKNMEIKLRMQITDGINFIEAKDSNVFTTHFCVSKMSSTTRHISVQFTMLGAQTIKAEIEGFRSTKCSDSDELLQFPGFRTHKRAEPDMNHYRDQITRAVEVYPEGIEEEFIHSVYFCPKERIHISTPARYSPKYVEKPEKMNWFSFSVKARSEVHIILTKNHNGNHMYEIVLQKGAGQSFISKNKDQLHLVTTTAPDILSPDEFRQFWISWENGNIQVGHGQLRAPSSRLMQWLDTEPIEIKYVGFSTTSASSGEFKIWRKDSDDQTYSDLVKLEIPNNAIQGSESGEVVVIGDVMGPTLKNLDKLLKMPFGCGEQNMINFAPNLYILDYLHGTKQLKEETEKVSIGLLVRGYQRQLTYRKQDGSYAAFGERDSSGSMWLTAFVLSSFSRAQSYIFIDENEIHSATDWIIRRQHEDGYFPTVGRVYNQDIQGGVNSELALTAYVLGSLLDAQSSSPREVDNLAILKARDYLEQHALTTDDTYSVALMAYTLSRINSEVASLLLQKLNDRAIVYQGLKYWTGDKNSGSAAEVEVTSYALLAYVSMREISEALPIVKWISVNRNVLGGFRTTQDTCVALKALSAYAIHAFMGGMDLSVQLASTNFDFEKNFLLNDRSSDVINRSKIPSLPTEIFVNSNGTGCALMQIYLKYNVPVATEQFAFDIKSFIEEVPRLDYQNKFDPVNKVYKQSSSKKKTLKIKTCAKWNSQSDSNMAVLEIQLLTGYEPNLESLEKLFRNGPNNLKRYDVTEDKIFFYFDEIRSCCYSCVEFLIYEEFLVNSIQEKSIIIYDYYEPSYRAQQYYVFNETSSEIDSTEGLNECKCNQSCDYDGPRICGSDGIFYRNQCKLDATNCELGIEISPSEVSKCQNPEPSKPKPARFPEIERPESEMNDSQISEIIEPPLEDLTNQKSSSYDYPYGVSNDYIVSNDYLPQSESSKEAFDG